MHKRLHLLILTVLIVLVSAWVLYSFNTDGLVYKLATIQENDVLTLMGDHGRIATSLLFFILIVLEIVIAPINPSILYLVSGLLFGGFLGGFLILAGTVVGSIIAFYIGKHIGRPVLKYVESERLKKFDDMSEKWGGTALFLLRVNPFTNFDLLSYVAGATKLPIGRFILATTLSQLPYAFLASYFANELVSDSPATTAVFLWAGGIIMIILSYFAFVHYYRVHTQVKLKRGK